MHKASIGRYESGKGKPSPSALVALAQIYGKPTEWFLVQEPTGTENHIGRKSEPCDMDEAMITYAIARPNLSDSAVRTISDFIVFVHRQEIERNKIVSHRLGVS